MKDNIDMLSDGGVHKLLQEYGDVWAMVNFSIANRLEVLGQKASEAQVKMITEHVAKRIQQIELTFQMLEELAMPLICSNLRKIRKEASDIVDEIDIAPVAELRAEEE